MIITDDEAVELKAWVVKKLEDISDADSDVLGDYVLALIRAETPEPELRLSAISNLEDFLQEKAEKFVDETFLALRNQSYKPGYVPPSSASQADAVAPAAAVTAAPSGPRYSSELPAARHQSTGAPEPSRKRSFNEHHNDSGYSDAHYAKADRQAKHLRRGGGRGGRYDGLSGRPSQAPSGSPLSVPPTGQFPFPGMPQPSTDPNDPLMAMMLQAMGMPLPPNVAQPPANSPPAYSPPPAFNPAGRNGARGRCSDYDTKGFCVKGNTCPFEHGNDHMVAPGQDVPEYDPKNSAISDVPAISPRSNGFGGHDVHMWGQGTSVNTTQGRGDGRERRGRGNFPPMRRPNRAEFSHAGPNHDRSNTTIVVENIPEEKFDEQSVRDFFAGFGNITNVDMRPYKRLAIVKYEDFWAAKSAYDSPKVIFDNRFVKVYWYKPDAVPTSAGVGNGSGPAASTASAKDKEPEFDKEEFERNAMAAQKKLEEKKALMKAAEAKRQALEKQKEELALKQAEEKKKLLEKLAAKGASGMTSTNRSTNGVEKHVNGAEDADDKASAQTKALRAQVAALEAEAKSLGLDAALTEDPFSSRGRGRGRGRARGSYRGWEGFAGRGSGFDTYRGSARGRGGGYVAGGAYNLDNRTKKVGVSGVELTGEKDEALRQHLFAVGEFEAIEAHPEKSDTQVITFKDRKTAERFMHGVKDIPGVGAVELAWVNGPLVPAGKATVVRGGDAEGDATMGNSNANGGPPPHASGVENVEVDYDVAEEDDRWMAS
ncbi:MAG: hypothetical protein LQ348_002610 [Seirophora lacunosa]|nr:MAG: hypothetical protein LQ348_002610 [Seirophora lacunosa]